MKLLFCLFPHGYHLMCLSSWIITKMLTIPDRLLWFGLCLFPDFGKTWLPDERVPHSISLKCHQRK